MVVMVMVMITVMVKLMKLRTMMMSHLDESLLLISHQEIECGVRNHLVPVVLRTRG